MKSNDINNIVDMDNFDGPQIFSSAFNDKGEVTVDS